MRRWALNLSQLAHEKALLMLHDLCCLFTAPASLGVVTEEEEWEGGGEEEIASMAFTLYSLIQTAILCTNAIAVLHEERFLSKSKYCDMFLQRTSRIFSHVFLCSELKAAN